MGGIWDGRCVGLMLLRWRDGVLGNLLGGGSRMVTSWLVTLTPGKIAYGKLCKHVNCHNDRWCGRCHIVWLTASHHTIVHFIHQVLTVDRTKCYWEEMVRPAYFSYLS